MVCKKCGYKDEKEITLYGSNLCRVCCAFAPIKTNDFQKYVNDRIDWKKVDTYRTYGHYPGQRQRQGMQKKAQQGHAVHRAPLGYSYVEGQLVHNTDAAKVVSLFNTFLTKNYSLNSLAKHYGLSTNGVKNILTNRTYLGELSFKGTIHKAQHKPLITTDIFYAVQQKIKTISKKKEQPLSLSNNPPRY